MPVETLGWCWQRCQARLEVFSESATEEPTRELTVHLPDELHGRGNKIGKGRIHQRSLGEIVIAMASGPPNAHN